MPRINLLPIRALQRREAMQYEMGILGACIAVVCVGLYFWYSAVDIDIQKLNTRASKIQGTIQGLQKDVSRVNELKAKEAKIKKKLSVIDKLIAKKTGPSRLMDELATILTTESKRVWIVSLTQQGNKLRLVGSAMEPEDVSEFQMALDRRDTFTRVVLKKVTAKKTADNVAYVNWEISCKAAFIKKDAG